jgi:hypothetical protein
MAKNNKYPVDVLLHEAVAKSITGSRIRVIVDESSLQYDYIVWLLNGVIFFGRVFDSLSLDDITDIVRDLYVINNLYFMHNYGEMYSICPMDISQPHDLESINSTEHKSTLTPLNFDDVKKESTSESSVIRALALSEVAINKMIETENRLQEVPSDYKFTDDEYEKIDEAVNTAITFYKNFQKSKDGKDVDDDEHMKTISIKLKDMHYHDSLERQANEAKEMDIIKIKLISALFERTGKVYIPRYPIIHCTKCLKKWII